MTGAAWSVVNANGTGSLADATVFQTDRPRKLKLDSMESNVIEFSFDVPGTVRAGASICTSVLFGDDRREPQFNTVGQSALFCIAKSAGPVLEAVPSKGALKLFQRNDGRTMTPSNVKLH